MRRDVSRSRAALVERLRIAGRDLEDLADQVDGGELDPITAASLESRYRGEIIRAQEALDGLGEPDQLPPRPPPAGPRRMVVVVVAGMAMALLTIGIVVAGRNAAPSPVAPTAPDPARVTVAELEDALAADPGNVALRLTLGRRYLDAADYVNAMSHFATVAAAGAGPVETAIAEAHMGWMAWVALGDPSTALDLLDSALQRSPGYPEAMLWKGVVLLYGMDDGAAAVPIFEELLVLEGVPAGLRIEIERLRDEAGEARP